VSSHQTYAVASHRLGDLTVLERTGSLIFCLFTPYPTAASGAILVKILEDFFYVDALFHL
jgi:hypothetical protein